MEQDAKKHLIAIFLVAAGFSSYAIGDAGYKWLSASYSVFSNSFFAASFSLFFLLIFAPFQGGIKACFKSKQKKLHLFRAFLFVPQTLLGFYAFANLPMANVYAVFFLAPLIASLLAVPVLKESIQSYKVVAILLGLVGVLVVLRPGIIPITMPVVAVFVSATLIAIINVLAKKLGDEDTFLCFAFYPFIVIIPCSFVLMLSGFVMPSFFDILLLAGIGFTGVIGITIIPIGFTMAPMALVTPFHYIQMIWAIIIGYLVFGDVLDIWTGIGASIIIVSGIYLIYKSQHMTKD